MKKVTQLQVNTWYGKKFTSADHLNTLAQNKVIKVEVKQINCGLHWSESAYKFLTHDGREIATVYKYSDWGFSSQAYGVELKNVTSLKSDFKRKVETDVWMNDFNFIQKNRKTVLYRLAKGETIQEYYFKKTA